jgi:hypothetical protein|tara:strand:- start:476 stop:1165 length:690 start_codon:yes stop_codon:yes gene_type:complete
MQPQYEYYYNNVPGKGLCRNNLIYTSLISNDKKTFVQWYYNDTTYHKNQNEVVDPGLMTEKWEREVKYLTIMNKSFPQHVPAILDIDYKSRKIYLEIDGVDLWEENGCTDNYDSFPEWKDQMLDIMAAHRTKGIYKCSLHPSSYFVVAGKLKSINYFFCYDDNDPGISIESVLSHISPDRRKKLVPVLESMGYKLSDVMPLDKLQDLAFESFRSNFPDSFIDVAKEIYV